MRGPHRTGLSCAGRGPGQPPGPRAAGNPVPALPEGGADSSTAYTDAPSLIIHVNLAGAVQFTEPYVMLKPPGAAMLDPAPAYSDCPGHCQPSILSCQR